MIIRRILLCHSKRFYGRFAVLIYILLVLFALFNYKSHVQYDVLAEMFSDPLFTSSSSTERCRLDVNILKLQTIDMFREVTFEEIQQLNPSVEVGGSWSPRNCTSWQRVAIIVPYRDRLHHLQRLLNRLHPMLQRQLIQYQIFVIEQLGSEDFNRGRLLNIGVLESLKLGEFDCFIFQDVDLLPEHDLNIYACNSHVHHLASAIDEMRYHVMYYNYAGGVVAVNRKNIYLLNGHANIYWGWGNEDDDFSARTQAAGLLLTRPPEHIGRYKMVRHVKKWRENNGNELFLTWRSRWKSDGLSSLDSSSYSVSVKSMPLYTNVSVDLGPAPKQKPLPSEAPQETWVWFLGYYFP